MIPANIIEEIRNKAEIVAVISGYVKLKKRGKNFVGLCPFHVEKDPSFTVSPEKQLFHCFGCNEGGNVFAFVMKAENIGFAEAVEELGAKLGIALPKTEASAAIKSEREKLYRVMELAAGYFKENIGQAADYLKRRGISLKTSELFTLGFVPEGWENLFGRLIARGVDPRLAEKSGLVMPREGKSGYYDRFRNRLIFPIHDHRGRFIAFGGRALGNEEPKYLNSPETTIYHKGEVLYGLNLSKDQIKTKNQAVMVEGYFDLITPFQAGITNIVATLGTALTSFQCKLLSRYTDTVILAFDADSAGGVASERSAEIMRGQGLKVKVAEIKEGKDPDEVILKKGGAAFENIVSASLPYLEFKLKRAAARHNLAEIEARAKALKEMAQLLAQEKDNFTRKEYVKMAAAILKTEPDMVMAEVARAGQYPVGRSNLSRTTEKPNSKIIEAEKNLIALAAQSREALELLKGAVKLADFNLPPARAIAEFLFAADLNGEETPAHFLMDNLPDEAARSFLSGLMVSEHLGSREQNEKIFLDCVQVLKDENQQVRVRALKQEIEQAEKEGKSERVAELLFALKSEIG